MNPILMLHGALGAKTQLEPIKTKLEEAGRSVYSMNFSGHNGEPFSSAGFGIEVFALDIGSFLKKRNTDKVDIFGYSMGGYVALWFAHQYPDRVGSIITLGTKFDWDPVSAEKEIMKLDPDKILEKVPSFARILEHRHAPNDWKEVIRRTASMMLQLGKQPLLDESVLRSIPHVVEVCLGDNDDMADRSFSEKVAATLPRGTFRLLENTPHPIEKTSFIPFFIDGI